MGIEKLIEQLNDFNANHISVLCGSGQCACGYLCDKDDCIVVRAATALSTLQAENEKLRGYINDLETQHRTEMCENGYDCVELGKLRAELEQVKAELNAAKSPEVLEAVDELMEFARTRMSTADWLYYVDVLGEWRGQKEG